MMKNYRLLPQLILNAGTILTIAFMLFAYNAWAAPDNAPLSQGGTPGVISYQGTLTDKTGQPVNGNTDITFRLYDAPIGGAALWTETHTGANAVPVQNGLFHVLLGSLTPIPASVWTNSPLYLGVQVGSEPEMTPREMLGVVPMAMTVPNGSITTDKLADGAVTPQKAPGLLAASDNLYMQYGADTVTASSTTDRLTMYLDFDDYPAGHMPRLFLQPAWNATAHVTATWGWPCDHTQCLVAFQRTDGGNWAAGQYVNFSWMTIGPRP